MIRLEFSRSDALMERLPESITDRSLKLQFDWAQVTYNNVIRAPDDLIIARWGRALLNEEDEKGPSVEGWCLYLEGDPDRYPWSDVIFCACDDEVEGE